MYVNINKAKIKLLRVARHWSQEELAIASGVGQRTIQRVESTGKASLETTKSLAACLEISLDELITNGSGSDEYYNIQFGYTILTFLISTQVLMSWSLQQQNISADVFLVFSGLLLILAMLFGSLTTKVSKGILYWHLGIGLIRKQLDINTLTSVRKVRNKAWWGWGIRYIGNGWLYNVSGLNAIELVVDNDRVVRIGTDEPDALVSAIEHNR